jgi:hypothetical protein
MRAHPYLIAAVCAVALGAGPAKTASALTVTETINFTANSFPAGAPVNLVIGEKEAEDCPARLISFDPAGCTSLHDVDKFPLKNLWRIHHQRHLDLLGQSVR